jgi:hypothetical protein
MPLQQIGSNDEDGATFGSAAAKLVGFHGSKCDQAAAITSVSTSAAVSVCGAFAFTSAQANGLITAVNSILAALQEKGFTA